MAIEDSAEMIKVHVRTRSGKFFDSFDLAPSTTVEQFKELFSQRCRYYPERQWFNIGSAQGAVFKDGTLESNGLIDGSTLVFKDLGVQMSWRLVFVIEYLGPLMIFPALYLAPTLFYPKTALYVEKHLAQKVAFWLAIIHYGKRELETLFVHRFSNATMPIERLPINCFHYWILFGLSVGYFLFHPLYTPWISNPKIIYTLAALFLVFEFLNFQTHIELRFIRPRGTKTRGIPHRWGFSLVSCANYFWESCAWLVYAVLTMSLTSWLFLVVAFGQMAVWAFKKHRNYIKEFRDYPRQRKAIVPFIL